MAPIFRRLALLLLLFFDLLLPALAKEPPLEPERVARAVEALNRQIERNAYYLSVGQPQHTNYVIDMRRMVFGDKDAFLKSTTVGELNLELAAHKAAAKIGVYLLIWMPRAPKSTETQEQKDRYIRQYAQAVYEKSLLTGKLQIQGQLQQFLEDRENGALISIDGYIHTETETTIQWKSHTVIGKNVTTPTRIAGLAAIKNDQMLAANFTGGRDAATRSLVQRTCQVLLGVTDGEITQIQNILAAILTTTDAAEVSRLLQQLPQNGYGGLTAEQRLHILKVFSTDTMTDQWFWGLAGGNKREITAVKVMNTTPAAQSAKMLEGFQENENKLLYALISRLDDEGFGQENFTACIFYVLKLIPASVFDNNWDGLLYSNKLFRVNNEGNILKDGDNFNINRGAEGKFSVILHIGSGLEYKEVAIDPFEAVGIIALKPLPLCGGIHADGHYAAAVPALYLYWLQEKDLVKNYYQLGSMSLNVLGLVSSVGIAVNATTWTVRIIAGLDAVSAAVAVGLDLSSLEQRIMDKYGERSPEHEFFRKLHLGLTIYNTGSLGINLLRLPQKLDDAIVYWEQHQQRLQQQGAITAQEAKQIDELLKKGAEADGVNKLVPENTSKQPPSDIADVVQHTDDVTNAAKKVDDILEEYIDVPLGSRLSNESVEKTVYALRDKPDLVIGISKIEGGFEIQMKRLKEEIAMLKALEQEGLPVVKIIGVTQHEGSAAVIMKRYAQGSKDIVANSVDFRPTRVGASPLLNELSIKDLTKILLILRQKKIKVDDLQFLIDYSGNIVITDPLRIHVNQAVGPNMSQTVYKLIEAAGENVVIEKILKVNSNKAYTAEELKEAFAVVIKNTAPKNVNVDDVNARMRNIILEIDRRILNGDIPINKDLQTQTYIYIN